jgi:hypothetical protein
MIISRTGLKKRQCNSQWIRKIGPLSRWRVQRAAVLEDGTGTKQDDAFPRMPFNRQNLLLSSAAGVKEILAMLEAGWRHQRGSRSLHCKHVARAHRNASL